MVRKSVMWLASGVTKLPGLAQLWVIFAIALGLTYLLAYLHWGLNGH